MFCTNCGAQVVPGQKFCNQCGCPVSVNDINVAPTSMPAPAKKKNVLPIVLAIVGVLLVVSIAGAFAVRALVNKVRDTINEYDLADGPYVEHYEYSYEYGDATGHDVEDELDDLFEQFEEEYGAVYNFENFENVDEMIDEFYDQVGLTHTSYAFANVYDMDGTVLIRPNGLVRDNTVLWNGKTVGGLCDFIDENVLQEGRKIDRNLLYDMISIQVVDPSIVPDDHTFEILMKYCLTVTNEFSSLGARMESASFNKNVPNTYDYNVVVGDKASMWTIDYDNFKITLNNGETIYNPVGENGMFSEQTMTLWINVIDYYFEIQ